MTVSVGPRASIDLHLVHPLALALARREGRRRVFADDFLGEFRAAGVAGSVQRCGGDYPLLAYEEIGSSPGDRGEWLPVLLATLEQIEAVRAEVDESPELGLVLEPEDWAALEEETVGVVVALEGLAPVGREPWLLDLLVRLGVRSVQPTWNDQNAAAAGIGVDPAAGRGLTDFGRECVRRMNELGVVIDVAHLAGEGIAEILELSAAPIMCSHANARALCDHPRNLTDAQIRAIAERGGLVAVTCYGEFIDTDPGRRTLGRLLDHVEHVLAVAGPDHVGVGSDLMYYAAGPIEAVLAQKPMYDSRMPFPVEFATIAGFIDLWGGLRDRGHSDEVVAGIAGGNFVRLFERVRRAGAPRGAS